MKNEIWKDIKDYEGHYQISNLGRVKSFKLGKEKIRKNCTNVYGYYCILLTKNNIKQTKTIHQLIAVAFLNHNQCGYKLVINHKDFNRKNNDIDNLEIVTPRENGNRKHLKSSSKYVGVCWHKILNKWQANIHIKGKLNHLGYFTDELEASKAYEKALAEIIKKIK